jgi:hypothetical protein
MSKASPMESLFALLDELESKSIYFVLARNRSDAISVCVSVPGERIEIDVLVDGEMEVSRFKGNEDVLGGEEEVRSIIKEYAD